MHNLSRTFPQYARIFQLYLGRRIYILFLLSFFSVLAEGFGLLMLLPLLQGLDGTQFDNASLVSPGLKFGLGGITSYVQIILSQLNLQNSKIALLALITGAFLLKGALVFLVLAFGAYLRGNLLKKVKSQLFDCYANMNYEYYIGKNTGHFINVINEQINRTLIAFNYFTQVGVLAIQALGYLILGFFVAWRFGFIVLVLGLILITLFRLINKFVIGYSNKIAKESGQLAQLLIQVMHAFKYLLSTGQILKMRVDIMASINNLANHQIKIGFANAITDAAREPIAVIFVVLTLFMEVIIFEQPLAPILVSILLFYRGLNFSLALQGAWQSMLEYIGSVELLHAEFKSQDTNSEIKGSLPIENFSKNIVFKNVDFSYGQQLEGGITNISLEIPARSTVALVGKSGAGKSTLVDLITLVLRPQNGQILIDGVSEKDISTESWRSQIGYVSQEMIMFDDTIANNICLGDKFTLSKDELMRKIQAASQQANISEFIDSLPESYETLVGDRGLRLSGGQRQRLFIARELFRNPNLLILDEATSALDSESERAIQKSIEDLKGRVTVIIIAHRFSTIRSVDNIYVFDDGHLVEQGSYEYLYSLVNSKFRLLAELQAL